MADKIIRILGKKGRTTIPHNIRKELGFEGKDILSYEVVDDNTIVLRKETLCEGDSNACAYINDNISLEKFLDSLTPAQQRKACLYLNVIWARNEGVNLDEV